MKKYIGEFVSNDDIKYNIVFTLLNSEGNDVINIMLGEDPIITEIQNSDDIFSPIKYDSAKINIVTNTTLDDFNTTGYLDIKVELIDIDTNKVKWLGYVKPQIYDQEIFSSVNEITVECNGFLSVLKYIEYERTSATDSFYNIIVSALKKVNMPDLLYLQDSFSLSYDDYRNKVHHSFWNLNINTGNFIDEDNNAIMYNEVLESIFKYTNMVAIPYYGSLYVIDFYHILKRENAFASAPFFIYNVYNNSMTKADLGLYGKINIGEISDLSLSKSKIYNSVKIIGERYTADSEDINFKDHAVNLSTSTDTGKLYLTPMSWQYPFFSTKADYNNNKNKFSLHYLLLKRYFSRTQKFKLHFYRNTSSANLTEISSVSFDDALNNIYNGQTQYIAPYFIRDVESSKGEFSSEDISSNDITLIKKGQWEFCSSEKADFNSEYNTSFAPNYSDTKLLLSLPVYYTNIEGPDLNIQHSTSVPGIYKTPREFITYKLKNDYVNGRAKLKIKFNGKFKPVFNIKNDDWNTIYYYRWMSTNQFGYDSSSSILEDNWSVAPMSSFGENSYNIFRNNTFEQKFLFKVGDKYFDFKTRNWSTSKVYNNIDIHVSNNFSFKTGYPTRYYIKNDSYVLFDMPEISNFSDNIEISLCTPNISFEMKNLDDVQDIKFNNKLYGGLVWYDDISISYFYDENNIGNNLDDIEFSAKIKTDIISEFGDITNILTTNKLGGYDKSNVMYGSKNDLVSTLFFHSSNESILPEEYKLSTYCKQYANVRNIIKGNIIGKYLTPYCLFSLDKDNMFNNKFFIFNSLTIDWRYNTSEFQIDELKKY